MFSQVFVWLLRWLTPLFFQVFKVKVLGKLFYTINPQLIGWLPPNVVFNLNFWVIFLKIPLRLECVSFHPLYRLWRIKFYRRILFNRPLVLRFPFLIKILMKKLWRFQFFLNLVQQSVIINQTLMLFRWRWLIFLS